MGLASSSSFCLPITVHCSRVSKMRSRGEKRIIEVGIERDTGRVQRFARRWEPISNEAGDYGHVELRCASECSYQKSREFCEIGDARENIDEQDSHLRSLPYPVEHLREASRFSSQSSGTDVEKVVGFQSSLSQLVYQHHREARPGRQQSDLTQRIH